MNRVIYESVAIDELAFAKFPTAYFPNLLYLFQSVKN